MVVKPTSPPATRRRSLGSSSIDRHSGSSPTPISTGSVMDFTPSYPNSPPHRSSDGSLHSASFNVASGSGRTRERLRKGQQSSSARTDFSTAPRTYRVDSHHPTGDTGAKWTCDQCGKTFTRRGHLKRHEENHFDSRKYQCDFCDKSFARNDVMLRHRAVHQPGPRISENSRSEAALKRARRACRQCSSVKMKCDGGQPCGRCSQKADGSFVCSYRDTTPTTGNDADELEYGVLIQPSSAQSLARSIPSRSDSDDHHLHKSYPQAPSPKRAHIERPAFGLSQQPQYCYSYDAAGSDVGSASAPLIDAHSISVDSPVTSQLSSATHHHLMGHIPPEGTFPMDSYEPAGLGYVADDSFLEPWSSDGVFDWLFAAQQISLPWQAGETSALPEMQDMDRPITLQQQHSQQLQIQTLPRSGTVVARALPLIAAAAAAAAPTLEETDTRTARQSPQDATSSHQWPNGLSIPPTLERNDVVPVILPSPTKETQALEDTCHVRSLEPIALEGLLKLPRMAELHPQQVEATETSLHATPCHTLNLFLQLYFEHFDRICPILHRPTFDPNTCSSMLLGAVCAIGATYSRLPNAFDFGGMLMTVVNRAIFARLPHDSHIFRNVAVFQALLLNFNFFRSSGRQRMLELAEAARSPLTTMTRKSRLFERSRQPTNRHTNTSSSAPVSPTQSETGAWLDWVEEETGRRTAWYYFVADLELSAIWKLPPSFALNELKAELPQDEVFWRCPTASTWMRMRPAMTGHSVYLPQLHDALRLRAGWKSSALVHKLEESVGPSNAQRMILAYSLVSLGISLHSLESTCLSAAIATATEDFAGVCKALVSFTSTSLQQGQQRKVPGAESSANSGSYLVSSPELATAELLLRFVLLRQCLDISELQLLAGRSGRREDMQRSLQHIRGHLVREPHKLWYALIHAGRIVHLCTCHAIDSMYEGCFLFYAATTLFVCAKIWPDFGNMTLSGDSSGSSGKVNKSMTVQVDNEQALSLDDKDWLAWMNITSAQGSDFCTRSNSDKHGTGDRSSSSKVNKVNLTRQDTANQFAPQPQHQHQPSHLQHQTPHLSQQQQHSLPNVSHHHNHGQPGNHVTSTSPSMSPFTSHLSTPHPSPSFTTSLIACITPTLAGIGDITRPGVPASILQHFADHLLSRPARTTWPIGKLLGRIMGEMAAVFGS